MTEAEHELRAVMETPVGMLEISVIDDGALRSVSFLEDGSVSHQVPDACRRPVDQLTQYFDGQRTIFDLDLEPSGTDFEKRVWDDLVQIPFGATDTYGEIARRLGDPGASRAVGTANARNPIAIVIPCHRVIGTSGELTGYAGGLWRKKWLLAHESGQGTLEF